MNIFYRNISFLLVFGFFMLQKVIAQDTLIMRNGELIPAKVISLDANEVRYKKTTNIDGPDYVVLKNSILEIRWNDGRIEKFNSQLPAVIADKKLESRWGDWIKINTELGAVVNDAYCNAPFIDKDFIGFKFGGDDIYSKSLSKKTYLGYSFGVNFSLGKSEFFKHLVGFNYLKSEGNFNYQHTRDGSPYFLPTRYQTEQSIRTTCEYINIFSGFRTSFKKRIHFDNFFSWNCPIAVTNTLNGYELTQYYEEIGPYWGSLIREEKIILENQKNHKKYFKQAFSYMAKFSTDFTINDQKFGVYFSRNFALFKMAKLPWMTLGIVYYPIKKFS
jgi:hypothetical protein